MEEPNRMSTLRRSAAHLLFVFALAATCLLAKPALLHAQSTTTQTKTVILTADHSVIQQVINAARERGIPFNGVWSIPLDIIRTLALNALFQQIGTWIRNYQLCELFDLWAAGKAVGATGTLTIEFILVAPGEAPTPASPRITVNFHARKTGQNTPTAGNSGSTGWVSPIGPGGQPVPQLDLFGNGEFIVQGMVCPIR